MKKLVLLVFFSLSPVVVPQSDTSLVLLKNIDSTIVTDVRYATKNNFTHQILYPSKKVYLRKIVAQKLSEANMYFIKNYNYRIKIFDGYRPLSVQKLMWKIIPDERYVANPSKGSRHNRGAAVDITLIDSTGKQLNMGTGYDNFTSKAHINYVKFPGNVLYNRKLLRTVMLKFGFQPISSEWWHFDYKTWKRFSILDISTN